MAQQVVKKVGEALSSVHAGDDKLAARKLAPHLPPTLAVRSPAFRAGQALPPESSADGGSHAPVLAWGNVPENTRSLVLLCEDPDAPFPQPFVHWMVYGIPAATGAMSENAAKAMGVRVGKNSKLERGFTGAAPPPGHGLHHYHFQLFALDAELELDDGAGRGALLEAMNGHVVAWGDLVGTYEKS